jgi:hypothetical protein
VRSSSRPPERNRAIPGTRPFHRFKTADLPLMSLSGRAAYPRPNYSREQGPAVTVNNSLIPLAENGINASLAADGDRWMNSGI